MVNCKRCEGLMVRDSLYFPEEQFLELEVGRCLNCGHTVDLTMLKIGIGKIGEGTAKKEKVLV